MCPSPWPGIANTAFQQFNTYLLILFKGSLFVEMSWFHCVGCEARIQPCLWEEACFHCLLAGHQARDCKFWPDLLWGFEGCQHKHYRLVHNHLETGLCSIEIWWVNLRMMRLEVQNQKSLLTILLAADSHGLRHSTGGWIHFNPDCDGGNLLWK